MSLAHFSITSIGKERRFDLEVMAVKFEYELKGDPAQKLELIKQKAAQKFVYFVGDLKKGTFSGGLKLPLLGDMTVKGSYKIDGDKITVAVSKKPSSYTWAKVDSMLREFIESDQGYMASSKEL